MTKSEACIKLRPDELETKHRKHVTSISQAYINASS